MSEPLDEERLSEIRKWLEWAPAAAETAEMFMAGRSMVYLAEAVDEIGRKQTQLDAAMKFVRTVANAGMEEIFSAGGYDYATYVLPYKFGEHARAMLASYEKDQK